MARYYVIIICLIASFLLGLMPTPSQCADPDPLQDFCIADLPSQIRVNGFPCKNPAEVTSEDFFFEGFNRINGSEFDIFGFNSTLGEVTTFPGLNTQGLSQNRIRIRPGGINQPHIHPRATELSRMEEGALFVGIITTSGQFFSRVARRGELFVVPRGLLHFELNIGFEIATFFASFNSQNPGVIRFVTALFNSTPPVPEEVLTAAFRVSNATIDEIRRNVTGNPYVKQYYLRH